MRPPTPDPPSEEELIGHLIAQAGDPHVAARPEHVAGLRALLLERLGPPQRPRRWRAPLLAGSGLAAAAVVLALLALGRPGIAWAQVAQALRGRPWVHGTVAGPDGKVLFEQWLSSDRQRAGERAGPAILFHDYERKVLTKYVPAEGTIARLPEPPQGMPDANDFLRPVLDQLLDPAGPSRFPFPGMELIGQARRTVEQGGRKWLEIELTLRVAGGSRGGPLAMRIRVDPATKLPASLAFDAEDGKRYTAAFDYPDRGPVDIYDLGAPRTAKVVDRTPPDAVASVLARQKAARRRFDDYCAFVVEERILPTYYFPRTTVYRVWRKGPKWRIERLRPEAEDWAPPPDVDTAWWTAHRKDFLFVPVQVCDGRVYWEYHLSDAWQPGMPVPKPGTPVAGIGQTVGPNPLQGPADDPFLSFRCQELLPEQGGHPSTWMFPPDHDHEYLVDPHPAGGPPGTILFRIRDSNPRAAGAPDYLRLWIDPSANDLAMREELRLGEPSNPAKVAFIATRLLEETAKSPKGYAYPTRTRQISHNGTHEVVWRFFLDFTARIPDELFQPLN